MKISLLTVCRNAAKTLALTLESVRRQKLDGFELEYLVIDGGSTDGSVDLIRAFADTFQPQLPDVQRMTVRWISEPDHGLYDGINKGIRMATGDVIGLVNADDVLAEDDTLVQIVRAFDSSDQLDAIYADVRFVPPASSFDDLEKMRSSPTVRYCTGRFFRNWMFRFATFPAHPSTYIRKRCFERYGLYSLDYAICADFELMLRFFHVNGICARYLPICTTVMRKGGVSTRNARANVQINQEDLRALRSNGVWSCLVLIYLKYIAKIWGYILTRHSRQKIFCQKSG